MNWSTFFFYILWLAVSNAAPPEIEKAISVTTIEDTSATVDWKRPNDSAGSLLLYNISIIPRIGVNIVPPVVYSDRATRCYLSNLIPSTNYTLRIWTVDSSGFEGKPNSKSFTTRPPRVASITVSQITTTGAKLSWKRPNGTFDHYIISCPFPGEGCTPDPRMVPANESNPQAFLSLPTPGEHYYAQVYTILGTTSSPKQNRIVYARPVPVVLASVSVSRISTISATVKWDEVITGVVHGYTITLTPQAGRSPFDIRDRHTGVRKLTDLIPATQYTVTFQTYTLSSWYMRSDEVGIYFTTARPDINITLITSTTATAIWTKLPGAFDYYNISIERNQSRRNEITVNGTTVPSTISSPTVKLLGLVPGNTYRVHVRPVNGSTNGLVRSSEWFQTKPAAVARTTLSVSNDSATLMWIAVTIGNVANYTITINPTHGGANAYPSVVTTYPWRTELRNLTAGTEYNITIRTNYGTMESEPATAKFQTRPNPLDATSISLGEVTTSSARVTWQAASGNVDSYIIAVSGGRAEPSTVANVTVTTTLRGLSAGREYTVMIRTRVGTVDGITVTRNFVTRPSAVKISTIGVKGSTANSATLTWGAVFDGNIDYYSIRIRHSDGNATSNATVELSIVHQAPVWVISRSVALKKLTSGTEYTITIRTRYGSLESDPVEFNFTTALLPVDAASIVLTDIDKNSAKVTWDSVDGNFENYIISIKPSTGGAKAEPDKVAKESGVLTTDLKNLTAGSFYIVTIRTVKGTQRSEKANQGFQALPDYNNILAALIQTSGSPYPATISHLPSPGFSLPPIIGLSMLSVAVTCMVGWLE